MRKEIGARNIDAIDFLFSTAVVPRYVLRYFSKDADSAELLMNRWSLWKVFEYVDTDATPGFDPAVDTIVSHYRLFNRQFTQMNYRKVFLIRMNYLLYRIELFQYGYSGIDLLSLI